MSESICLISFHSCAARLRTRLSNRAVYAHNFDDPSQTVEIVQSEHNHGIITERRKKGSLKTLKDAKKFKEKLVE